MKRHSRSLRAMAAMTALVMALAACASNGGEEPGEDDSGASTDADDEASGGDEGDEEGDAQPEESLPERATVTYVAPSATAGVANVILYAVPLMLGFFEDENLDVDYVAADGSTAAVQAVASGSGDLTNADAAAIPAAVSQGVPVKGFASIVQEWPWQFAVLADSDITSVADLDGGAVGIVSLASGSKPFADAVLEDAGLQPEVDVELVPVGARGPAPIAALQTGEVQALALYREVYVPIEQQGIELRYLPNPSLFDGMIGGTWVAAASSLQDEDSPVVRFARASFKGMLAATADPEMAVRVGYEVFPERLPESGDPDDGFEEAVAELLAASTSLGYLGDPDEWAESHVFGDISADQWSRVQEFAVRAGTLEPEQATDDLSAIWDDRFIDAMNDWDRRAVLDAVR